MQRSNEQNKHGARNIANQYDANHHNTNIDQSARDLNATSSNNSDRQQSGATAMNAQLHNPQHRSEYEVAGPHIGGTPQPYDSVKIEHAKDHLVESMNKLAMDSKDNTNTAGSVSTTGAQTDQFVKNSTQDVAGIGSVHSNSTTTPKTSTSPTNMHSVHQPQTTSHIDHSSQSAHISPSSKTNGASRVNAADRRTGDVMPTTSVTPLAPSHSSSTSDNNQYHQRHHGQTQQQHLDHNQQQHPPVSMKHNQVPTAAVMGAASAISSAPPLNDNVTSTTDTPVTPGQAADRNLSLEASPHHNSGQYHSTHPGGMKSERTAENKYRMNDPNASHHQQEQRHQSITDKVKSLFHHHDSATTSENELAANDRSNVHSGGNVADAPTANARTAETAAAAKLAYMDKASTPGHHSLTHSTFKSDHHGTSDNKADAQLLRTKHEGHQSPNNTSTSATTFSSNAKDSSSLGRNPMTSRADGSEVRTAAGAAGSYLGNKNTLATDAPKDPHLHNDKLDKMKISSHSPVVNTHVNANTGADMDSSATTYTPSANSAHMPTPGSNPATMAKMTATERTSVSAGHHANDNIKSPTDAAAAGGATSAHTSHKPATAASKDSVYMKATPHSANTASRTNISSSGNNAGYSMGSHVPPTNDRAIPTMPGAYKSAAPQVGPGEEVVWVKTTTITDPEGNVVESRQNIIDPR
ncbi:hypothetical protein BX616_010492 [Lobosporangium transversale]|uniref:Uncharacterized protein n=1 Tax=Lobosporangium transversale TaxID=64571 RepID=A0A1Y2GSY5_9FUNG|nr:hypothetical protein BCR41DRAFT_420811 [Lobosporangium transversale]KAF9919240.1 hypothetical protein BX616_010492 [Lobosporangium transversale]ORZ21900.1 hypothetical protein BCR41DRAFT_420811 [Lobosporangium transversale]|eukprot:XP_021883151.1 hypothetical protein BCR41DRAFT_420811 [Lobosporangium transversale]